MCFLKWKKKYNQLEKDYIKLWAEYQLLRKKMDNSHYEKEVVNEIKNREKVVEPKQYYYPKFKKN